MTTWHYVDISLHPDEDMSKGSKLNKAMQVLHSFIKEGGGIALAFPDQRGGYIGDVIRLFFNDEMRAKGVHSRIVQHFFFRDYARVSDITFIDNDSCNSYVSYTRYRIPSKKSDRNNSGLWQRRFDQAQALPFFYITSASSKQAFMLRIKATKLDAGGEGFSPNGYGLGSTNNPVILPDIPLERTSL